MRFSFLFYFLISLTTYAQFHFTGSVNEAYKGATAYLSLVDDCNKKALFFTESILLESNINSEGNFSFKGDFLPDKNRIYKIHVDNCNGAISDYKHLLNNCKDSKEILFIANNTDIINFPLNDLSQIFCSIDQSSPSNTAIIKMEELQEVILGNLQNLKSDRQRRNIYLRYYREIQEFSKQFKDPLVEVYAYHLYANENFLSRKFYLKDLKKSDYYNDLLYRLETKYPNTKYTTIYRNTLIKDQYPLLKSKNTMYKNLTFTFGILLLLAFMYIYYLYKKNVAEKVVDYKDVLTNQEQKVFELMSSNSNKEIADRLFVSLSTIKSHINNIYAKLSINSRKEISIFLNKSK